MGRVFSGPLSRATIVMITIASASADKGFTVPES